MLIMNQKNNAVLNLDHIKKVFTAGGEVLAESRDGDLDSLGDYDTAERANAVLMEIICTYSQYSTYTSAQRFGVHHTAFEPPKVYTMPEE